MQFDIESAPAQEALGARLARVCRAPGVIYLRGDLGTGKTTLVRGFLRALGYSGAVKSPTYTLLEPYSVGALRCYHLDLYRLADPEELEYLGLRDLLDDHALILVEWPERGSGGLPPADLEVNLSYAGLGRQVRMVARSATGRELMRRMENA